MALPLLVEEQKYLLCGSVSRGEELCLFHVAVNENCLGPLWPNLIFQATFLNCSQPSMSQCLDYHTTNPHKFHTLHFAALNFMQVLTCTCILPCWGNLHIQGWSDRLIMLCKIICYRKIQNIILWMVKQLSPIQLYIVVLG